MKPNIETLPCFDQVAKVIGRERARLELWKVAHCERVKDRSTKHLFKTGKDVLRAIPTNSPQKWVFWGKIHRGINPYTGEKVE